MLLFPISFTRLFRPALPGIVGFALLGSAVLLTANEPFLNKPAADWTEAEALQVLNDSPWAHPVEAALQSTPCDYEHPAFPGMYPEGLAQSLDLGSAHHTTEPVQPDGAHYVVRLNSVKPMQAAAQRLVRIGEKYSSYEEGYGLEAGSKPTSLPDFDYNPADLLTFSVILKQAGPSGESFKDYAFRETEVRNFWACTGIRTPNGQYHGVVAIPTGLTISKNGERTGIGVLFPRVVDGKPLIARRGEKLEFRLILNQRVFETTFYVSPDDLFDGTETFLRIPPTVD